MRKTLLAIALLLVSFCGFAQLALEDFEGSWAPVAGAPAATDWKALNNGVGLTYTWVQAAHSITTPSFEALPGTHLAFLQRESVSAGIPADFLISPEFNLPVNAQLNFKSRLAFDGDQGGIYKIMLLPQGADPLIITNYVEIQTWSEASLNPIQQVYKDKVVTFPVEYEGTTVRIAFVMEGNFADRWLIDNVKVTEPCLSPVALDAINIEINSADLTWDTPGEADKWEIKVLQETDPFLETGDLYTGSLPYPATGLAIDTNYKYYVRVLCNDGGVSEWAGPFFFSTIGYGVKCQYPLTITMLPYFASDNTLNYGDTYEGVPGTSCGATEEYLSGNDVVYEYIAAATGTISINLNGAGITSGVYVYEDCDAIGQSCIYGGAVNEEYAAVVIPEIPVTAGQHYYIVISSSVMSQTTPYNLTIQQVTCAPPVWLPSSNSTYISADLSWTNPDGASSWQIFTQEPGAGFPVGAGTTVTNNINYTKAGLEPATLYEAYVRADCGDGTFSEWVGPLLFNTSTCEPEDQCTYSFIMTDSLGNGWNGNKMTITQNGIYIATIGPSFNNDFGPISVPVQLCTNQPFELYWNNGGIGPEEVGISIVNSFGQIIYNRPAGVGEQNSFLYTSVADCLTPACIPPINLSASNPTQTTADLNWDATAGESWDYYIVEAGGAAPTATTPGINATANTVTVGELIEATEYEYYVRMVCSPSENSVWGGPFAFSTASCPASEQCDYTFTLTSEWWIGWMGNTMTVSQNGITVAVIGATFTVDEMQAITIPICNGLPFEIYWNAGGDFDMQVGISVTNPFGQVLFSKPAGTGTQNTMLYTGAANCLSPACIPPGNIMASNPTLTTIDVTWDALDGGVWEYYVIPSGQPAPGNDTPGTIITTNTVTINDLDATTNYNFYVRMVCSPSENSEWGGPLNFNTLQVPVALPYDQDFELTTGWSLSNGNQKNRWIIGTATSNSPTHSLYISDNNSDYKYFVDSASIVHAYKDIQLPADIIEMNVAFNWKGIGELCCDYLRVWLVPATFTPEPGFGIDTSGGGIQLTTGNLNMHDEWQTEHYNVNASTYQGQVMRLVFEWTNSVDWGENIPAAVDNIHISVAGCPKPIALAATDVTMTQATLSWEETGSATSWEIYMVDVTELAPTDTATGIVVTSNPYIYTGLVLGENYKFFVRSICVDSKSQWSGSHKFATDLCADEDKCDYTFIMRDATGNAWSMGGTMRVIQNGLTVAVLNGPSLADGTNPASVVVSLCSGVPFELYWDAGQDLFADIMAVSIYHNYEGELIYDKPFGVGHMESVLYSATAYCSEITCPQPTGLLAGDGGENYITLDWTAGGTETQWEIIVQLKTDPIPTAEQAGTIVTGTPTYLAEGIVPITFYDYYVRAVCGPDDVSYWSGPYQFFIPDPKVCSGIEVYDPEFEVIAPGSEIVICPGEEKCIDLSASYVETGTTESYAVQQITYAPPFPFTGGTEVINNDPYLSATWIKQDLPFDFCFFGESYSTVSIGTLGLISFNDLDVGDYCFPFFNDQIPHLNTTNKNAIYGVFQDIMPYWTSDYDHPSTNTMLIGEYPCRALVVNFSEMGLIGCFNDDSVGNQTSQIVIYETTNIIEVYVKKRVACNEWHNGAGLIGIQNAEGTVAFTPPGRNTGNWTAYNEAWRFTPNGAPNTVFEWLQDGVVISTEDDITVCVEDTTTITARLTYTNCNGEEIIKESEYNFRAAVPVTINEPMDIVKCSATEEMAVDLTESLDGIMTDPAGFTFTFYATEEAAIAGGNNFLAQNYTVAGLQTIYIRIAEAGSACYTIRSFDIIINVLPVPDAPEDVTACNSYTLTGLSGGSGYYTATGGTGTHLSAGDIITVTQTLYIYAQSGTAPNICSDENSFTVTILQTPQAEINGGCEGSDYVLEAVFTDDIYNVDNTTIEWINTESVVVGTETKLVIPMPGTYSLVIAPIGQADCSLLLETVVDDTACEIPRGISPNGDGKNDSFDLSGLEVNSLTIFNRYGLKVYTHGRNYTNQWHGQGNNGEELPTGTYYYSLEYKGGKRTGWVYINRNAE